MAGESSTGYDGHGHRRRHHYQASMAFNPTTNNSDAISSGSELSSIGNYFNTHVGSLNLGSSLESPRTNLGLKHDTGLAVDWSVEEQYKLDEGLAKYANEPNILRYIKISSLLRDKTVRDVALRCRWMSGKRRKQEDPILARKDEEQKVIFHHTLASSSLERNMSLPLMPYSSVTGNHHHQDDSTLLGALSGTSRRLLEENNQALGQISANLSALKLQQNIGLFLRTRNNLTTILNDMKNTPGIMSRMPPLTVILNDELVSSILFRSAQSMMFGSSAMAPLKQEPGFG